MHEAQLRAAGALDTALRRVHSDIHHLSGGLLDVFMSVQRLEDKLDRLAAGAAAAAGRGCGGGAGRARPPRGDAQGRPALARRAGGRPPVRQPRPGSRRGGGAGGGLAAGGAGGAAWGAGVR